MSRLPIRLPVQSGCTNPGLNLINIEIDFARILVLQGKLALADSLLTETARAIEGLSLDESTGYVRMLLRATRGLAITELLHAQGHPERALKECEAALRQCRIVSSNVDRHRNIVKLETELLVKQSELHAATGNWEDAITTYQQSLEFQQKSLKAKLRPVDFVMLDDESFFDEQFEPGPFFRYLETQLRFAMTLNQAGRPYQAEQQLSDVLNVAMILAYGRPASLRYRVVIANTWALAAKIHRCPHDAQIARAHAARSWSDARAAFSHATEYRSGVHGVMADYEWFFTEFSKLDEFQTPIESTDRSWLLWHAMAQSCYRSGQYRDALGHFKSSVGNRHSNHAYDWLHIASCHAQVGQFKQARSWYNKAIEQMRQSETLHPELVDLHDKTRQLMDEKGGTQNLASASAPGMLPDHYQFAEELVEEDAYGLQTSRQMCLGPDGHLYVSDRDSDDVKVFNATTGQLHKRLHTPGGELDDPWALTFGPDGRLYVSGVASNNIVRFDPSSGDYDVFISAYQNGGMRENRGLVFGPDGHLYATSRSGTNRNSTTEATGAVLRFDGITGRFRDIFVPSRNAGLRQPGGLKFGPDGHLYVASTGTDSVKVFDGTSGEYLNDFIYPEEAGLKNPLDLEFRQDGYLYVTSRGTNSLFRFAVMNGLYYDTVIPLDASANQSPKVIGFAFDSDGQLLVSFGTPKAMMGSRILRYVSSKRGD